MKGRYAVTSLHFNTPYEWLHHLCRLAFEPLKWAMQVGHYMLGK
jgi:hypothetical protein